MKAQHLASLFLFLVVTTACVSKKKYVALQEQKKRSDVKVRELSSTNRELEAKLNKKTKEAKTLDSQLEQLKKEYNEIKNQMLESNARKTSLIEDLNKKLNSLSSNNKAAKDSLQAMLVRLDKRELNYSQKQTELRSKIDELGKIETALASHKAAIDELEKFITHNLDKNSILSVYTLKETGMLYITFDANTLFKADGTSLEAEGVKALKILGAALKANPDAQMVAGANWADAMSATDAWSKTQSRADVVFKHLIDNNGIDATRFSMSAQRIKQQKIGANAHELALVLYPPLAGITQFAN